MCLLWFLQPCTPTPMRVKDPSPPLQMTIKCNATDALADWRPLTVYLLLFSQEYSTRLNEVPINGVE